MKKVVILGNVKSPMGRPEPYSWFVLTYTQGLKMNGVDVHYLDWKTNSIQQVKEKLISMKPDVVFTHLSFHFNLKPTAKVLQMQKEVKNAIGCKFVHVTMDARSNDRYMGDVRGAFDIAFVGNFEMLENGRKSWKIPAFYSPYSSLCYDKMASPSPEFNFNDAVFTGGPKTHPDRWAFIQKLQKRIPIKIYQTQSDNDVRNKTPELSASAKLILGLCTGYNINGYIDVRPWQYLGAGACCAIRRFKGMDDLIPRDLYFGFDTYNEGDADLVAEYYRRSLSENTMPMREKAFNYIQQNHSCKIRLKEIIDRVGEV
jgi:hypothetical protein